MVQVAHPLHRRIQTNWASTSKSKEQKMKAIKNFIKDESGLETIEYAIVAAIVAAVALLIYGAGWGGSVQNTLKNASSQTTTATL